MCYTDYMQNLQTANYQLREANNAKHEMSN